MNILWSPQMVYSSGPPVRKSALLVTPNKKKVDLGVSVFLNGKEIQIHPYRFNFEIDVDPKMWSKMRSEIVDEEKEEEGRESEEEEEKKPKRKRVRKTKETTIESDDDEPRMKPLKRRKQKEDNEQMEDDYTTPIAARTRGAEPGVSVQNQVEFSPIKTRQQRASVVGSVVGAVKGAVGAVVNFFTPPRLRIRKK